MLITGYSKGDKAYTLYGLVPLFKGNGQRGNVTYIPLKVAESYQFRDDQLIGKNIEVYYDEKGYIKALQITEAR